MEGIGQEIYHNGLFLYFEVLPILGIDKHNSKKDLLLLAMIDDLLTNNCYYEFIDSNAYGYIKDFYHHILNRNPQLKYCRVDIDNRYNNLDGKQFIEKYQMIDPKIID